MWIQKASPGCGVSIAHCQNILATSPSFLRVGVHNLSFWSNHLKLAYFLEHRPVSISQWFSLGFSSLLQRGRSEDPPRIWGSGTDSSMCLFLVFKHGCYGIDVVLKAPHWLNSLCLCWLNLVPGLCVIGWTENEGPTATHCKVTSQSFHPMPHELVSVLSSSIE